MIKKRTAVFCIFLICLFKCFAVSINELEQLVLPQNNEDVIHHNGYSLLYDEENEQCLWVAYVLTYEEAHTKNAERSYPFKADPFIKTGSATPEDYRKSGYDRGHMAPFADLSWSVESAEDSFFMSNISPQLPSLNRGKWAELEKYVRSATEKGPVCVITGPVLTDGPFDRIGLNKVSVPHRFYKILLCYNSYEPTAVAFILPNNEKSNKNIWEYAVTVDEAEEITGINFFPLLENEEIESKIDYDFWITTKTIKEQLLEIFLDK